MNVLHKLEKSKEFWFLLITSCVFFILRLPSLFEPYWYGDEGIYQTMAQAMNNGSLLYRDIWDNKPPLLYVLYGIFYGDQFSLRLLSLLFGIVSIIVFFFLAKRIAILSHITQKLPVYIATVVFAYFFAIPLFEGNIANAENFILLPILLAGLLCIRYIDTPSKKGLLYAGILLSLAFLIKIVALFDLLAFVFFMLILRYPTLRDSTKHIRSFLPFLYGFFIPLAVTFLFFAVHNAVEPFVSAAFAQNIGYVGYGNTLLISHGLLYLKIVLLLGVLCILFFQRKKLTLGQLFIYTWVGFSLFSAFFSQRPYTHYILVLLPSFCLFSMLIIADLEKRKKHLTKHTPLLLFHSILFFILLTLVYQNFTIYKKNIAYYQNFVLYMMDKKSLTSYQEFFDGDMPRWYAVAQFLQTYTKTNDTVFVWGNPGQIYKMSETLPPGRYTVAYHITNSKETMAETAKALVVKKPRFIVIVSQNTYPFDLSQYRYVYSIQGAQIYEYLF